MRRWIGALFLLVASCTTIRVDPSMPSIDAEFYSAEGMVQGEIFRGLRAVSIKRGEPLSSLGFNIQSVFSGSISIESENCNISRTFRYDSAGLIPVFSSEVADRSCVISWVIVPELPSQRSNAVVVHGMKGALAIRVLGETPWVSQKVVLARSQEKNLSLDIKENNEVRLILSGCGVSFDQVMVPKDGIISLSTAEISSDFIGLCIASGVIISPELEDLLVDVIISKHSDDFVDLPTPAIRLSDRQICVDADPAVSFIIADSVVKNKTKACFSKDSKVLRGITAKGRSFLGKLKNGVVEWK